MKNLKLSTLCSLLLTTTVNGMDLTKTTSEMFPDDPLKVAIRKGDTKLADIELKKPGVDINKQQPFPYLWTAVDNGKLDMVKLLLAHPGINVDQKNEYGSTPLFAAVVQYANHGGEYDDEVKKRGVYKDIIKLLIKSGADVNAALFPPSFENVNAPEVGSILCGMEFSHWHNFTPFFEAVRCCDMKIIKLFISESINFRIKCIEDRGKDANKITNEITNSLINPDKVIPPFFAVIDEGCRDAENKLSYFIEKGANIKTSLTDKSDDCEKKDIIRFANERKKLGFATAGEDSAVMIMIEFLFNDKPQIDWKSEQARSLLDLQDEKGRSLLHICITRHSEDESSHFKKKIKILLKSGANVNIPANDGTTPFFKAFMLHDYWMINDFIRYGEDLRALNCTSLKLTGLPLFSLTLKRHSLAELKLLIENGLLANPRYAGQLLDYVRTHEYDKNILKRIIEEMELKMQSSSRIGNISEAINTLKNLCATAD